MMKFATYSRHQTSRSGQHYYAWCVFVQAESSDLHQIREVEYTLHPTFPNPVRVIRDPDHCFALLSGGWGNFSIGIRIINIKGAIERQSYPLRLSKASWPLGKQLHTFDNPSFGLAYDALLDEKWHWRELSSLCRASGLDRREMQAVLAEWETQGFVRRGRDIRVEDEELWGATYRVGLLPVPLDIAL